MASKHAKAAPTTVFRGKDTIYVAATLPSSIGELLAAEGSCRKDAKIWVWYHAKVNGAVPHDDARKSGFHTDLLDATEARTKSIGGWLIPKQRETGPKVGYSFAQDIAPMLVVGDNQLELWVVATCPPADVLGDELRVELARTELTIKR
ncbi:MAG: hypothetical protein M3680_29165 [Myxococcota bacterium]|nr:hypothetical protein [Myxococcota bacterium]